MTVAAGTAAGSAPVFPPGWYLDPTSSAHLRWWSGEGWTDHLQPLPVAAPAPIFQPVDLEPELGLLVPKLSSMATRALVWGIVAVVLPYVFLPSILAIVYGVVGMANDRTLVANGRPSNATRAKAGVILGIVGAALGVAIFVLIATLSRR